MEDKGGKKKSTDQKGANGPPPLVADPEHAAPDKKGTNEPPPLVADHELAAPGIQPDVQKTASQLPALPDDLQVKVAENSTVTALMYVTQDGKHHEMPCTVNRPILQLVKRPLTMLVGSAAAAVFCKDEHFCCVELKPGSKMQDICDWFSLHKGSAGLIVVNFEDNVSLSDDFWKIVSTYCGEMTVAVVSQARGRNLLEIFGSDMNFASDTLTRILYVKIFPKQSEFETLKGPAIPERIPFQMPWRACCLTLDRVKCLHYLPNSDPVDEPFLYIHLFLQQDTYESIHMALPSEVKNSKWFKGIVVVNYSLEVDTAFFHTPYRSGEVLMPLYLVGGSHGQLFLQKMQPQQFPPPNVGLVHAQASRGQLDISEALQIRFVPVSGVLVAKEEQAHKELTCDCHFYGSVTLGQYLPCHPCSNSPVKQKNYRWLKLLEKETGPKFLSRIQKVQQMGTSEHVVGFIVGSPLPSSHLPDNIRSTIRDARNKEAIPPLIVLNEADYDQFRVYIRPSSPSEKVVKFLSNSGMLHVRRGNTFLSEGQGMPCNVKEYAEPSVQWLPLLGPTTVAQIQPPYVRVVPAKDRKINRDVLQIVRDEVKRGALDYIVMGSTRKENASVRNLERNAVFVDLKDVLTLLSCVTDASPVVTRDEQESASLVGTVVQGAVAAGRAFVSMFRAPRIKMAPDLEDFKWSSCAKDSVNEFRPQLQQWSNVQDKDAVVKILHQKHSETKLNHFPLFILAAVEMQESDKSQLVDQLYHVARNCNIQDFAKILTDFTASCSGELKGGEMPVCATMAKATKNFLDLQPSALFRIFWTTLWVFFNKVATGSESSAMWGWLTSTSSGCDKLTIAVEKMKEMKTWIALAQHLKMDKCQLSFDIIAGMIRCERFQYFTVYSARILLSELHDEYFLEAAHAQKVLALLRAKRAAVIMTASEMKEGIQLVAEMSVYKDDANMRNELLQWMRKLATFKSVTAATERFVALRALAERMGDATLQEEMLAAVTEQIRTCLYTALRNVSLKDFAEILKGLPFLDCEICVEYFKQFSKEKASVHSIATPNFTEVCNLALRSFQSSESIHEKIAEVLLKPLTFDLAKRDKQKHLQTLLHLEVPKLFDMPGSDKEQTFLQTFVVSWKKFFESEQMQVTSQECFSTFLAQTTKEFTPYQKVVMKAFVPCIRITELEKSRLPEHPVYLCLERIISSLLLHYNTVGKWTGKSIPPYDSFWEIIKNITLVIPVAEHDVVWCQDWRPLVKLLVKDHCRFQIMVKVEPDKELADQFADQNAKAYFKWVTKAQESLRVKAARFTVNEWSEEDATQFDTMKEAVVDISKCLNIDMSSINTATLLQEADDCRKKAIEVLFRYSHGEWVWLLNIMSDYVVAPLQAIQDFKTTMFKTEAHYKQFVEHVAKHGHEVYATIATAQGVFKKDVPLKYLKDVVDTLEDLMAPLQDCMEELVFFHSKESHLFKQHMQLELEDGSGPRNVKFKDFVRAVKSTKDFLHKFQCSQVTYLELKRLQFFHQRKAKKESEMALLHMFCHKRGVESTDFLAQLRDMLNLLDALKLIPGITKVFDTFQMQKCTAHSGYQALIQLQLQFSSEKQQNSITGEVAAKGKEGVLKIIHPLKLQQLELFSVVGRSAEFYEFLKTIEQQGTGRFQDLHRLITQYMQHEEYNEAVLNQLPRAREYMLPFLDKEQDFPSLLMGVQAMCDRLMALDDFSDLETINHNMNLIRLWFSKAEDHTLESVQKDLGQIMSTGVFLISEVQQSSSDSPGGCLLLSYQPSGDSTSELWKEDGISDFSRRLGLLERSQGQAENMSEKVDKFQYNYKIARKILQIWLELKSMRSPKAVGKLSLQCSATKDDAEEDLRLMKLLLDEWKQTLHQMRMDHPELCLFKIYKVFQMFKALQSKEIEKLTQEMLLLFTDAKKTGLELIQTIQGTLLKAKEDFALLPVSAAIGTSHAQLRGGPVTVTDLCGTVTLEKNDAIETVGKFLTSAFDLLKCHLPDLLTVPEAMPSGHGILQPVVHKLQAVRCSQRDLLTLLWSEYSGKKVTPFEIYRCHKGTTEEDLSLFFSRIEQFCSVYTLLDVNVLPLRLQEVIVKLHKEIVRKESNGRIHYVVTGPSLMQDLPQVTVKTTDHDRAKSKWSQMEKEFRVQTNVMNDFSIVEIVYGRAGDGKSRYILKKLDAVSTTAETVTLTINESFSMVDAIQELRQLPLQTGNGLYLNFTLLPSSNSSSEQDQQAYKMLVTRLQYFLFDLFFLGYIEDPQSGLSFSMPKGLQWQVYVEVPTREFRTEGEMQSDAYTLEENRWNDPHKSLEFFFEEYPVLQLVRTSKRIQPTMPLDIDENAQLVCKYLQAYESREDRRNGIDCSFRGHESEKVTFRSKPDCPKRECQRLLNIYMPKNAKLNKMNHFIFIRYMARRCMFLDMCPAYNYNEVIQYTCKNEEGDEVVVDTSKLGSSLLESMLKEVDNLCSAQRRSTWGGSGDSRQQLVYVSDGMMEEDGGCFELVALNPDDIPEADREKFARLQVPINDRDDLETRDCLDKYLSSAFGVMRRVVFEDGQRKKRLKEIDDKNYVLTLDFAMKMLELNERYHAGVPVIIEGETGVGKTFLVEMMADLWNSSLLSKWDRSLARLWTKLAELCKDIQRSESSDVSDEIKITAWKIAKVAKEETNPKQKDLPALQTPDFAVEFDEEVSEEEESEGEIEATLETVTLEDVNEILENSSLSHQLVSYLKKFLRVEPLLPLLEFSTDDLKWKKNTKLSFDDAMEELQEGMHPSPQVCGIVLFHLLKAAKPRVYFKKNIHGALSSKDMRDFMEPIVQRANEVRARWKNPATCPRIIVFLDEINTTSCPGLMKELLVDTSFHGKCLPPNVFIIGACNPHRSNSVAMHEKVEESGECDWVKGSYYVHRLHPTVRCLLWNYGALDEEQEERYIETKMKMAVSRYDSSTPLRGGQYLDLLSSHIFKSQCLVREFAAKHYEASGMDEGEAKELAKSCVSQRDIQRVFTMYEWLLKTYDLFQDKDEADHKCYDAGETWQQRAILVALGLVYYFRLNKEFREAYKDRMERICGDITFTDALNDEMNFYCDTMSLPPGIAKTTALKENLFCIIACCCTKTPLIIVGEPGSSKTLSFNLAAAAFRGVESKIELFKNTDVFPGFDPYYYQCSRRTTSVEVETVFKRAVNRQRAHEVNNRDKFHCVVFMDEAGLPEESMESLKVLHKYLDDAVVSFVGITNHILDAAKSNRAVTLFRPRAADDVSQLAMGCFGLTEGCDRHTQRIVNELCDNYGSLIEDDKFTSFFGLRDFIHFVNYLRRATKGRVQQMLSQSVAMRTELVIGGVQRNFNGHQQFEEVCKVLCKVQQSSRQSNWKGSLKNLVKLLQESLEDRPFFVDQEDFEEIRYKLVIDPTEDDSSRRFMMEFGLLHPSEAKTLVGSDFPDDGDLQRINTIAEITHAASQGETVLMLQTDDIHESFYDLFNQHFRKIPVKGEGGKRTHFYANVAIGSHSKPCRVHPEFQCIVVIKESDLAATPAPFLNRFEKYRLSPKNMLEAALDHLPRGLKTAVQKAVEEVEKLVKKLDRSSFCGMRSREDTIMSVFLDMVPKKAYTKVHLSTMEPIAIDEETGLPSASLLKTVLLALKDAGFTVSELDTEEEWDIVCNLIKGYIPSLPHLDMAAATTDAWTELTNPDTTSDPQDQLVCLIQDVLCHWMYASAAKKILQILTPEALILWRRSKAIPPWYFDSYLKQQHHFNLKELITSVRNATQKRSSKGFMKMVCFTRSSQAVSQLTAMGDTSTDEERVIGEIVVTSKPQRVKLCRMSTVSSQQEFSEQLAEFQGSDEKDIMLIVANMHEATKKLINYVRLRIDEEEEKWILKRHESIARQDNLSASEEMERESLSDSEEADQENSFAASEGEEDEKESCESSQARHDETEGELSTAVAQSDDSATDSPNGSSASLLQTVDKQTKAYVLLLHFPPSVSQRACYPALFLYGWDYHYLDSLVASAECAIPLNEWCHVAFQQTAQGIEQERVAIDWSMLLNRTASVMASRIALYDRSKSIPVAISTDKKADMFRKLLQGSLGQKLHDLYSSYWTPRNVAKFLQGAAVFARCRMSMISVTDVVQNFFESTLHNFLAYMLYHISEELGLDAYVDETKGLFVALLDFVPRPKSLSDLKGYNNTWGVSSNVSDQLQASQFPGFSKICASIETCLTKRFDEMMEQEERAQSLTASDLKELSEQLQHYAHTRGQDRLKTVLPYLEQDDTLWERYETDFIKFRFAVTNLAKMKAIVDAVVCSSTVGGSNLERIVALHFLAYNRHHDVVALEAVINPLQGIQMDGDLTAFSSVVEGVLVKGTDASQSDIAYFIIESLFSSLMSCIEDSGRLQDWQKTCRSILFTHYIEKILYSKEYSEDYRGKFNMVQAAFLHLQCAQDDSTLHKLLRCFSELLNTKQSFAMREIFSHLVDAKRSSSNNQDYASHLCQHCFHRFSPRFYEDDILYFFEFVATLQFDSLVTGKQCVTLGVLKHCMLTVLKVTVDPSDKNFYGLSSKVSHMLELQLEKCIKGSAANYRPPCFEMEPAEVPPSSLAHIYFLTLLDHVRLKHQFETQHRPYLQIHEMLHNRKRLTAELPIMHAIEKQVLLHVLTKQLSVALLDDKLEKQIDTKKGPLTAFNKDQFHLLHKQMLMDMIRSSRAKPSEKKLKKLQDKVNTAFAGATEETDKTSKKHLRCHLQNPWTYEEMKSYVTESTQARGQRDNPHILLLHRLMDSYEKLNAGLDLIPILLQFCCKLKKHLDFKCHEQDATKLTLKAAVDKACSEMKSSEEIRQLRRVLFNEFIDKFCKYQSMIAKTRRLGVSGDTPLMHIFCLTADNKSAVNRVLQEICDLCNSFISTVHKCAKNSLPLLNWVTLDQPPVSLLQYHDTWQLLSRPLDKESLMSCFRRCLPVYEGEAKFEQLSAEVIKTFFFGLSVSAIDLDQLSNDRVFRLYCQSAVKRDHNAATEYSVVCTQLRTFQGELETSCRKDVFAHFHGINHRMLQSVVDGLLMIAHHLTQDEDASRWAKCTMSRYILNIDESHTVKDFINLPRDMPGVLDLHFLEMFQIGNLLGALKLLVSWLETGFCNFHTLPLGVKKEMPPEMVQCMEEKAAELQVEQKTNLLIRLEEAIPPEVMGFWLGEFDTSAFELPLKLYLKDYRICKSEDLLQCIPEEVRLEHYVHYLILIRRLTEKDRLPTSNDGTDSSDSEEEEESESEEEEEEQQSEIMEEEAPSDYTNEEDWEKHSDGSLDSDDRLNVASSSNPENEEDSSWNRDVDEQMYDADIAKGTVAVRQVSVTAVLEQGEDSLTIGAYKSEEEFQSASDNDTDSDDSNEGLCSVYETVSAQQNCSRLPSQSSIPPVHQGVTGLENDSDNDYLSASEGNEETTGLHEESLAVNEGHQIETVSPQGTVHVVAEAESTLVQADAEKQLATDLPQHQKIEDSLEQVINLPEQTQVVLDVSQDNVLSKQEEVHSSAWVEEASPRATLPEPSPAASSKIPSSTIQAVQQPELLTDSLPVTVADVCEWLKKIGMGQYAEKFKEEGVDGQILVELGKEDLPDLGIEKSFHQTKLLVKIRELKK